MKREFIYIRDKFKNTMIQNFLRDGYLQPILFFYKFGKTKIIPIPDNILSSQKGKDDLSDMIRRECRMGASVAGMIIEAYVTEINIKTNKIIKDDAIVMIFSTPEKEDQIVFKVNIKERKILQELPSEDAEIIAGRFSGFFNCMKN